MEFTTTWYEQRTHRVLRPEEVERYDSYAVTRCECGALVTIKEAGTSHLAYCARGHRWQHNFQPGEAGGWVYRP